MKKTKVILALVLALMFCMQGALACTIQMAGTEATVDGSTMTTHNDDSGSADFRLWIIPAMEGGEGMTRDLVIDSHNYGDFSDYPNTKDYGNGMAVAVIDQPEDTHAYFHSRYSFINEKGVAMGEATNGLYDKELRNLIYAGDYLMDAWNLQDIALERAETAREAVEIMGALIDEFGFRDSSETMNVVDGNECWVFECYGGYLWAAVKIPNNAYFVAANRAVVNYVDFTDVEHETYLWSENLLSFAVENGLYAADADPAEFSPARTYCPSESAGCQMREWRAFDLVAPSLGLKVTDTAQGAYPLYVIPDEKVSVQDLLEIAGDYYEGTEFDKSQQVYAGDFGNVLDSHHTTRSINAPQTCYVMIANVKNWLPDEVKCLVWYGYGAGSTTFLNPLWPSMTDMPDLYSYNSTRYDDMTLNAGWWINMFVQDISMVNYDYAEPIIHERRDSFMVEQYETVAAKQEEWAAMIEAGQRDEAVAAMTEWACANAEANFQTWIDLGWELHGDLTWGRVSMKSAPYSDWWKGIIASGPVTTIQSSAPGNKPVA